ncbi:MAG: hypothetical protein KKB95_01645, partial [Gammaproteobacteria bacterium]|nr:hypothetical protein [Gammaproteobacteria bacterium]MBU1508712.1 hypothetical protein [Gammaproteobacteria bacterium]MBU2123129.1 hypothetical protein [Gammaproteobacteria bacterium]
MTDAQPVQCVQSPKTAMQRLQPFAPRSRMGAIQAEADLKYSTSIVFHGRGVRAALHPKPETAP